MLTSSYLLPESALHAGGAGSKKTTLSALIARRPFSTMHKAAQVSSPPTFCVKMIEVSASEQLDLALPNWSTVEFGFATLSIRYIDLYEPSTFPAMLRPESGTWWTPETEPTAGSERYRTAFSSAFFFPSALRIADTDEFSLRRSRPMLRAADFPLLRLSSITCPLRRLSSKNCLAMLAVPSKEALVYDDQFQSDDRVGSWVMFVSFCSITLASL